MSDSGKGVARASGQQQEFYFKLHRDVQHRYAMRRLRAAGVPYAEAAAWRVVMMDLATKSSTFGEFTTDVRAFVEACGGTPTPGEDGQHAMWWRLFEKVGLVEIDGDPSRVDDDLGLPAEFRVRVPDAGEVNEPRKEAMSSTERSRRWRQRQRSGDAMGRDATSPALHGDAGGTGDVEPHHTTPEEPHQPSSAPAGAHTSALTREDGDDNEQTMVTARQSNPAAQVRRARGELGRLAIVVDALADALSHDRGRTLTDHELAKDVYRPAMELLAEFGPDRLSRALATARENGATSMRYVATVCRSSIREDTAAAARPAKPVIGDPAANALAVGDRGDLRPDPFLDQVGA